MDMRIPLASVLVVGGLVGLALPTDGPQSEGPSAPNGEMVAQGDHSSETVVMMTDAEEPVTWAKEIALDREPDGHFYADVSVDGTSSRMLVDTGASVIALTGDDAAAIGLTWDTSQIAPVAQGASGAVHGVRTRLDRVTLGEFEARDVEAIIVPEGLGISLLGQSFLSTVNSVAIAGDRMVLEN